MLAENDHLAAVLSHLDATEAVRSPSLHRHRYPSTHHVALVADGGVDAGHVSQATDKTTEPVLLRMTAELPWIASSSPLAETPMAPKVPSCLCRKQTR